MSTPSLPRYQLFSGGRVPLKTAGFHGAAWLAWISYEQGILRVTGPAHTPLPAVIYFYGCNIGLFYLQVWMLRRVVTEKPGSYLAALGYTAGGMVLGLFLKGAADWLLLRASGDLPDRTSLFRAYLLMDSVRNFNFIALGTLYWTAGRLADFRLRAAAAQVRELTAERDQIRLTAELNQARNAYLSQQLHPHLLFNALNFIYSSVYRFSPAGADCVLLLTDMMRFSVDGAEEDGKVSLAAEIQQLENLIAINRHRYQGRMYLDFEISGKVQHGRIVPLTLLTLAENVCKHGQLNDPGRPARLQLQANDQDTLTFTCRNGRRPGTRPPRRHQVGLYNLRIRLNYTYGTNYQLLIREEDNYYETTLMLPL